jgi:N-acetylglucosamine kinase
VLGARRLAGVDVPALRCGCGQRGCLDTLAGARGVERLDALLHGGSRSSTALLGAWRNRDTTAAATVEAWLDLVAGPLALVVHATGAGVVPVAGGLGNDHALIDALDLAVRGKMITRPETPLVVPARLGATAGLVGAALRLVGEA